ncbi:hypothetical protein PIB30_110796, partial [Stylosanthes scabra]|nr:hypothetical protein [Stylosanthes scabra]
FKFKIFWVDSDAYVRAMFEFHRRVAQRCTTTYTSKLGLRCPMINGGMQRGPSAVGATGYAPCCPTCRASDIPRRTEGCNTGHNDAVSPHLHLGARAAVGRVATPTE